MQSMSNESVATSGSLDSGEEQAELTSSLLDELHPCCLREKENNRKKYELQAELRKVDRSNVRIDELKQTFLDLKAKINCYCCESAEEYPLLRQIKQNLQLSVSSDPAYGEQIDEHIDVGGDDDDDEYAFLNDIEEDPFYQEIQKERASALQSQLIARQRAERLGHCKHVQDSEKHLLQLIESRQAPLVLHIYDSSKALCARIDIALEELASKYIGSKFRRLECRDAIQLYERFRPKGMNGLGIASFINGDIASFSSSIEEFGDDSHVNKKDIESFLEHSHVLLDSLSSNGQRPGDDPEEDADAELNEETGYYNHCGQPGCSKRFAHEHVGKGSGGGPGNLIGAATANLKGAEAFTKNHFLQL